MTFLSISRMGDMTAAPPPVPRRGRAVRVVVPLLAVLGLVLLGTAAAAWLESRSPSNGWFAYAPLSDTTYVPGGTLTPGTAVLLSGAGALLLGGAVGFVVGRRGRPAAGEV
jgi:heme/copper-type cytochrome/quinol oxidase subunit 1